MLTDSTIIDLAHEKAFRLGAVTVNPPVRELVSDTGERESLEPRVMQVLVALARAGGELLTRDDLTACCWGGVIVGDDSINRVISRLRRSAETIGLGAFRIDTVTKVGYRLVAEGQGDSAGAPAPVPPRPTPDRRVVLAAGGLGAAALLATGLSLYLRARPKLPPDVQDLYDQGWTAVGNVVPGQVTQAQGLFRQVVAAAPNYADGWGSLAFAYGLASKDSDPALVSGLRDQTRSAAQRALQLEPHNALAELAMNRLTPFYGDWAAHEQVMTAALRRHPDVPFLYRDLEWDYASTGRMRAAAALSDRALSVPHNRSLVGSYRRVVYLWSANRLDEADRTAREALETYRRSRPLWFTIFYFLMYTGRPEQALAMADDTGGRPLGVADEEFESVSAVARAIRSRARPDIDRAMDLALKAAHQARGYAENAMQFAAFLGHADAAFEVADAYYFGRGFQLGTLSFTKALGQFYGEPRTLFLFYPSMAPVHADPRFDRLMDEIGLKAHWAKTGQRPDYLGPATAAPKT